jgi:hypothetical protein
MHKRILMSCFHRYYKYMNEMGERGTHRLAPDIQDEVFMSVILLAYAHTDIRVPVSGTALATDSTVTTAGACQAFVPPAVARSLYRTAEKKGEHVRLDWTPLEEELGLSRMHKAGKEIEELVAALPWGCPRTWEHREMAHINLQDVKALREQVQLMGMRGFAGRGSYA